MMQKLLQSIKEHEGFVSTPYIDTLVEKYPRKHGLNSYLLEIIKKKLHKLKLTFGYGFTFITKEESDAVIEMRVRHIKAELEIREPFFKELPEEKQDIILEMAYQMGVSGVLKFRKMWGALREFDYLTASIEMLDSKWAREDTQKRAGELSLTMKK